MSRLSLFAVALAVAVSPEHSAEDEQTKVGAVRHYGQATTAEGADGWTDEAIADILHRAAHPAELAILVFDTGAEIVNRADVMRLPEVLRLQGELDELRQRISEAPPQKPGGGRVFELGPVLAEMYRKSFDEVFPLVVDLVHFHCNPPKVDVADIKDLIAELVKGGGGMVDMVGLHLHVGPQGASVRPEPETTTPERRIKDLMDKAAALVNDPRCPESLKMVIAGLLALKDIGASVG